MKSQSDQQERARSSVQNFGSACKGFLIALGLPLGCILFGVLFHHEGILVIGLLTIILLPLPLLFAAQYFSSRGRPGDPETVAGICIGLLIIFLLVVWGMIDGGGLGNAL